jgi:hypothetical protein
VLRGKRILVAVDNVWERGPLDALAGLAPGCTVMFTTRRPELATTFGAIQITVDELTQGQALELLGRWTGRAAAELPPAARALCTRVGNLALGVAMAGAMVARGRSFTDVAALIEQDLTRVHADLDPAYQYRNLLAAIEAGISDLPKGDQQRYEHLAVFAGRGPFPREAAGILWWPELAEAEVGDLLAELAGRSLLTAAGNGWYAAHDLCRSPWNAATPAPSPPSKRLWPNCRRSGTQSGYSATPTTCSGSPRGTSTALRTAGPESGHAATLPRCPAYTASPQPS